MTQITAPDVSEKILVHVTLPLRPEQLHDGMTIVYDVTGEPVFDELWSAGSEDDGWGTARGPPGAWDGVDAPSTCEVQRRLKDCDGRCEAEMYFSEVISRAETFAAGSGPRSEVGTDRRAGDCGVRWLGFLSPSAARDLKSAGTSHVAAGPEPHLLARSGPAKPFRHAESHERHRPSPRSRSTHRGEGVAAGSLLVRLPR